MVATRVRSPVPQVLCEHQPLEELVASDLGRGDAQGVASCGANASEREKMDGREVEGRRWMGNVGRQSPKWS